MAVCQNHVALVNIKIAGKWMFIPLKMKLIGIDPYPYNHFDGIFPSLSHPAIAGLPWSQAAAATGTSRWGRQRKRCGEPRRRAHGDDVMRATQRYMGHVFHKMLGKKTMNVIISILIDNDDSNNTTNNYSTLFNKLHRVYTHLAVCQNQ